MTYCTQQDLIDRFGALELVQLTDRTNKPASTIDPVVVDRHVQDATSLIDGYIGKAYSLPLATVPAALVKVSADIARYFLHGKAAEKDLPVERNYQQAIAWLRDVSRGLVIIENQGAEPVSAGGQEVRTNEPERPLSAGTMKGYI